MKHLYSFLLSALVCLSLSAQNKVSGDSLAADFHYLVKQLEAAHPDPYTGFGGKVFFHKQAFDLEMSYVVSPIPFRSFGISRWHFCLSFRTGIRIFFSCVQAATGAELLACWVQMYS